MTSPAVACATPIGSDPIPALGRPRSDQSIRSTSSVSEPLSRHAKWWRKAKVTDLIASSSHGTSCSSNTRASSVSAPAWSAGSSMRARDSKCTWMVMGDVSGSEDVLVRAHSECLTSDTIGYLMCDWRQQLEASPAALRQIFKVSRTSRCTSASAWRCTRHPLRRTWVIC